MRAATLRAAIASGAIKTRADAAREYAIIVAVEMQRRGAVLPAVAPDDSEIGALNMAIVNRWSAAGLDWIKKRGWQLFVAADS